MPTSTWNSLANRRQFARFLLIGGACTLFDLGVYVLWTQLAGLSPPLAKGLSYLTAMGPGFLANKFWAFGSRRNALSEPAIYASLYTATLLVNVAVNSAALAAVGREPLARLGAFVVATSVTTVLNFLGLRLIAFRQGIEESSVGHAQTVAAPAPEAVAARRAA